MDDTQVSEKKGKINTVCAYRRRRLAKMGIAPEYMSRVVSPLGSKFLFEKIDMPISITPIRAITDTRVKEAVIKLAESREIEPNYCYSNAIFLADYLKKQGVPVKCVEGFYNVYGEWCKHRFNEIDGVFFDATAELFIRDTPLNKIQYHGFRLYSSQELYAIAAAFAFLSNKPYKLFTTSTLPYNPLFHNPLDETEAFFNEYCLDEKGVICYNDCGVAA